MNAKTAELFENEEFLAKIFPMSYEEAVKEVEAQGGEITIEELHSVVDEAVELVKRAKENGDELDDESLDQVAGGAAKSFHGTCVRALAGAWGGFKAGTILSGGNPLVGVGTGLAGAFIAIYAF